MKDYDLILTILNDIKQDTKETKEHLNDIKIDVELNKEDLKRHIARSEHLESIVEQLTELIAIKEKELENKINIIDNKLTISYVAKSGLKMITSIGIIVSVTLGIMKLIGKI